MVTRLKQGPVVTPMLFAAYMDALLLMLHVAQNDSNSHICIVAAIVTVPTTAVVMATAHLTVSRSVIGQLT